MNINKKLLTLSLSLLLIISGIGVSFGGESPYIDTRGGHYSSAVEVIEKISNNDIEIEDIYIQVKEDMYVNVVERYEYQKAVFLTFLQKKNVYMTPKAITTFLKNKNNVIELATFLQDNLDSFIQNNAESYASVMGIDIDDDNPSDDNNDDSTNDNNNDTEDPSDDNNDTNIDDDPSDNNDIDDDDPIDDTPNSEIYSGDLAKRMLKTVNGGSLEVREVAAQLLFGEKIIELDGTKDFEEIRSIIMEALTQNPLVLEGNFSYLSSNYQKNGKLIWEIEPKYTISNPVERKNKQEELLDKAENVLSHLEMDGTVDDIYKINNYIINTVDYDHALASSGIGNDPGRNAYGALIEGEAVCSGYSDAFNLLCTLCNYGVITDCGSSTEGLHAWNWVDVGDDNWYMVDTTWNDIENSPNMYNMVPNSIAGIDRTSDLSYFSPDSDIKYFHKVDNDLSWDYLNRLGLCVETKDIDKVLKNYFDEGLTPFCIRVTDNPTKEELNHEVDELEEYIRSKTNYIYDLGFRFDHSALFLNYPDITELSVDGLNKTNTGTDDF